MRDPKFGYHWIWMLPLHYVTEAYLHIHEKIKESGRMKVRVMKCYTKNNPDPFYEVQTWKNVFWFIGYWQTQIRTTDFNYATSVFLDYKDNKRGAKVPKDEAILIHYE
jgi:hypothetical protein